MCIGLALRAGIKYKRLYERLALNVKVEPLSTFALNASRLNDPFLNLFYFSEASQIHVRNRRKIYATVEIHLWCLVSNCCFCQLYLVIIGQELFVRSGP